MTINKILYNNKIIIYDSVKWLWNVNGGIKISPLLMYSVHCFVVWGRWTSLSRPDTNYFLINKLIVSLYVFSCLSLLLKWTILNCLGGSFTILTKIINIIFLKDSC